MCSDLDLPAEVDTRLLTEHRPEEAQDLNKNPTEPGTTELLQGDVQESGDVTSQSSMELREGNFRQRCNEVSTNFSFEVLPDSYFAVNLYALILLCVGLI